MTPSWWIKQMCIKGQPRAALGRCSVKSGSCVQCLETVWAAHTAPGSSGPSLCQSMSHSNVGPSRLMPRCNNTGGVEACPTLTTAQHHWLLPICGLPTPWVFSTLERARAFFSTLESLICMAPQAKCHVFAKVSKVPTGNRALCGRSRGLGEPLRVGTRGGGATQPA